MACLLHFILSNGLSHLEDNNIMTVRTIDCIPKDFIEKYIDECLKVAQSFGTESLMGTAIMKRAEVVIDLVEAYKKSLVK
jgi:hypothetical protein